MMKKRLILIFSIALNINAFSQDYKESAMSFALGTTFGFREINKINGGAYAKNTSGNSAGIGHDFKFKPIYWSAAYAIKHKTHEFGFEFERQNYASHTTAQGGVNITYDVTSSLKLTLFNFYYKYLIPIEYKKFTPYVKTGFNMDIYTYHYDSKYTNTFGPPGTNSNGNVGLNFSLSLYGGVNYSINKNLGAFTEFGLGPNLCKFGARYSFFKNIMNK